MRKRDIVIKVSEKTSIKQVVVGEVFQGILEEIISALQQRERVELRNFGIFYIKRRKGKKGRNPKTGEVVPIPSREVVLFKPGKDMKAKIMQTPPFQRIGQSPTGVE